MKQDLFTIQEVSNLFGVSAKTLRRWEEAGLINPIRTAGNQRRYRLEDIKKLRQRRSLKTKHRTRRVPLSSLIIQGAPAAQAPLVSDSEVKHIPAPVEDVTDAPKEVIAPESIAMMPLQADKVETPEPFKEYQAPEPIVAQAPFVPEFIHQPIHADAAPVEEINDQVGEMFIKHRMNFRKNLYYGSGAMAGFIGLIALAMVWQQVSPRVIHATIFHQSGTLGANTKSSAVHSQSVLAATDQKPTFQLQINAPTFFNSKATFLSDVAIKKALTVTGLSQLNGGIITNNANINAGKGKLTASNVIYSLHAGSNISITGDAQNPTISANASGVTSLQGTTGDVLLTGGTGISISGTTISNSDKGSAQNIFKTITAGGTDIAAGTNTDKITFAAGSGIIVSGDAGSKTITITSNSSGTLSGLTTNGILYATSATDATSTGVGAAGTVLHGTGGVPTFSAVDLSSDVTNVLPVGNGGTGTGTTPTNGEILIGNGTGYTLGQISGTANQVTVTNGSGTIGISLPQDIGTGSTPTFAAMTLTSNTNQLTLGTGTTGTITMLSLTGNRTYTLPDASGTICLIGSGCGGAAIGGSGTTNYLAKFVDANDVGIGSIYDNGHVGIGTTSPQGLFSVSGGVPNVALVSLDDTNGQDILTGSSSGTTRFVFDTNGDLTINGGVYQINGTSVLSGSTLGAGVVNSSLTSVGALNAGSITSGFGTIDTGADGISGGIITSTGTTGFISSGDGAGLSFSGPNNHIISATSGTLELGAATLTGNLNANSNNLTNVGSINGLTITANTGVITAGTWNGNAIGAQYGGTGINTSASTGVPYISGGTWSVDPNELGVTHGGTGQTTYTKGDILYSDAANSLGKLGIGTNGQILTVSGTGVPVWGNAGGTINDWQEIAGGLSPFNITDDLLLGGTSTSSAKFVFTNNAGGTPTASISGSSNTALYLTGSGTIGTTNKQSLTLGSASTGNIILNGFGSGLIHSNAAGSLSSSAVSLTADVTGILPVANGGTGADLTLSSHNANGSIPYFNAGVMTTLALGGNGTCLSSNGVTPNWTACSGVGSNYFQLNNNALSPSNSTYDFLLGGASTSSAKFAFINNAGGTPTASIAGSLANNSLYLSGNGTIATTNKESLTIGSISTGNINFANNVFANAGLTVTNGQNLTLAGITGNSQLLYATPGTGVIAGVGATAVNNQCLLSGGGGVPFWGACDAGNTSWIETNGTILEGNTTEDVLLGGNATSSAKFAFVNVAGGTPTASISGTGNNATYLTGSGTLGTTNGQSLTLGSATTGNIILNGFGTGLIHSNGSGVLSSSAVSLTSDVSGILPTANGGLGANLSLVSGDLIYANSGTSFARLGIGGDGTCLIANGGVPTWGSCAGGTSNFWQLISGALSPLDSHNDLLLGSTATSSAKFAFINVANGTPTASISGSIAGSGLALSGNGTIQSLMNQTLTIGGNTTGNIVLASNGITALTATGANLTGSGTFTSNGLITGNNGLSISNGLTVNSGAITFTGFNGVLQASGGTVTASALDLAGANVTGVLPTSRGGSPFDQGAGAIFERNTTQDFLLGGTSSSSAKFAVLNINAGNTPVASLSGAAGGSYLTADGTLATTNNQNLTLGNASTGNITLAPSNGIAGATVAPNTNNQVDLGTSALTFRNIYAGTDIKVGGVSVCLANGTNCSVTSQGYFDQVNGVLTPKIETQDLLLGAQATTSAKFAFVNVNSGTPTASVSGGLAGATYLNANGNLGTTNRLTLAMGGSTTGNISLQDARLASPVLLTQSATGFDAGLGTNGIIDAINKAYEAASGTGTGGVWSLSGNVISPANIANQVAIGTTAIGNGQFVVNQPNTSGDIFSASASGIAKFTIANNGTISDSVYAGTNAVLYASSTNGTFTTATTGVNGQCLVSGPSGPTWGACGTVNTSWVEANGTIFEGNTTQDVLVGGTATGSAKFAFTNVAGGTPTASISGSSNNATYLTGSGTLGTTNGQSLTLGSTTTGNIILNGFGTGLIHSNGSGVLSSSAVSLTADVSGILPTANGGLGANLSLSTGDLVYANSASSFARLGIGGDGTCLIANGGLPTWGSCAGGTSNFWQLVSGALSPLDSHNDLLLGSTATSSAKFAFVNVAAGTPVASVSGGITGGVYLSSNGTLATTAKQSLTLGDVNTGNIVLGQNIQAAGKNISNVGTLDLGTGNISLNGNTITSGATLTLSGATTISDSSLATFTSAATLGISATTLNLGNGADATIGTTANKNLTLTPNGTGNLTLTSDFNSSVLIGNATTPAPLSISGGIGNNGALIVNQTNSGDLIDASASGITRFQVTNGGVLQLAGGNGTADIDTLTATSLKVGGGNATSLALGNASAVTTALGGLTVSSGKNLTIAGLNTNNNSILYTDGSGIVNAVTTATPNQCLLSGTNTPVWTACSVLGTNYFQLNNNALSPANSTYDFLLGGTSTSSAKFAFSNNAGGTPTASISAIATNNAFYVDANGNLGTTNRQSLILGNSTTNNTSGNILLNPNGTGVVSIGSSTPKSASLYVNGAISIDGGAAGLNLYSRNLDGNSATLYSATSGDLNFYLGNQVRANFSNNGRFAIGLNNNVALATLDVKATSVNGGTAPVASFSGSTSNASLVLDQSGVGDLFTASVSGASKFTIQNTGNIVANGTLTGLTGLSSAGTVTFSGLTTDGIVTTTGGVLGSTSVLPLANGGSPFNEINGSIVERRITDDLLLGSTATTSAKFAFTNVAGGTPTASIAAITGNNALSLDANGTITTTNKESLTLGNNGAYTGSGNILLNPNGTGFVGIGTTTPQSVLDVYGKIFTSGPSGGIHLNAQDNSGKFGTIYSATGELTFYAGLNVREIIGTDGRVAIGLSNQNPLATLDVQGTSTNGGTIPVASFSGSTSFASLLVDQSGSGDIFTASKSGATKFAVLNNGNVQINNLGTGVVQSGANGLLSSSALNLAGGTNYVAGILPTANGGLGANLSLSSGDLIYANSGSSFARLGIGGDGTCLIASGGAPTWGSCAGGISNFWQLISGALSPLDSHNDLLLGSTATASAKFAFVNVGGGTPTASISAGTAGATSLAATGTLQTTANQTLTLGGPSTGNIILSPLNGITGAYVAPNTNGNVDLGTSSLAFRNIYASSDVKVNGKSVCLSDGTNCQVGGVNYWDSLNGVITPKLETQDLLLGAQATTSAKFAFVNVNSGVPTASISGGLSGASYLTADGTLATTADQTLTLGSASTGKIAIGTGTSAVSLNLGSDATGDIYYRNSVGTLTRLAIGGSGQILTVSGGGTPTWSNAGGTINFWQENAGAVSPLNINDDLLLGATATSSAKFAFENVAGGTPVASVSAGVTGGVYLSSNGTIGTTARQSLTIGDTNTGNIVLGQNIAAATKNISNVGTLDLGTGNLSLNGNTITSGATLTLSGATTLSDSSLATLTSAATLGISATTLNLGNGADATIGTTANKNLTLTPNGSGNLTLTSDFNTSVFVGNATTPAPFSISGGIGNNGALIVNNTNSGDLIDASASGITKFQVTNAGNIIGGTVNGLTITNNGTNTLNISAGKTLAVQNSITLTGGEGQTFTLPAASDTLAGIAATQNLTNKTLDNTNQITLKDSKFTLQNASDTSKQLTFDLSGISSSNTRSLIIPDANGTICLQNSASCGFALGTNFWQAAGAGAITTNNTTFDVLLGGTSTASAKFAFLNNAGAAIPVASVSAGTPGAISLSANGTLSTTAKQSLTLGDTNTGNITLGQNIAAATKNISNVGTLDFGTGNISLNGNQITSGATLTLSGATALSDSGLATLTTASSLAMSSTSTLTLASNATINGGANANDDLTLQGTSNASRLTSYVLIQPNGGAVGVGTTSPLATLDIRGNTATTPVASIAGATTNAAAIVDQSGSGDLFTASKSGSTKFVVNNSGNLQLTGGTNFLTTINSAATAARSITLPDASGTICLQGSANCGFATGTNYWQAAGTGAIAPFNTTYDMLLGGTSTSSAKFAFINNAGAAVPVASISAQNGNGTTGLVLGGDGSIQSLNNNTLTIGGGTTGNINISPNGGANGLVSINAPTLNLTGTTTLTATSLSSLSTAATLTISGATALSDSGLATLTTASSLAMSSTSNLTLASNATINGGANANDDLTLQGTSNGTRLTSYVLIQPNGGAVGVGTTNPLATLDVRGNTATSPVSSLSGATTNAVAILDQSGTGDIFTASKSGSTKFVVNNTGNLQLTGGTNFLTTINSAATAARNITLPDASGTICLQGSANCGFATGTNYWQAAGTGAITTGNTTFDMLLGGTSTSSARFAFIGNAGVSTPIASISAQNGNGTTGLVLGGDGSIQSLNNNTLTIGGGTTGNIVLKPNNGSNGLVTLTAPTVTLSGTSTLNASSLGTINTGATLTLSGATTLSDSGLANITTAAGLTLGSTTSLTLGSNSTINGGANANDDLTLQGTSNPTRLTSYVLIQPNGGAVGVGTSNPLATLDIRGNTATTPGASVSASSTFAAAVVDQSGSGDLFTASKSGATKFTVLNNGNLSFAGSTNFLNTITSAATAVRTYTLPDASGTICLQGSASCGFSVGTNYWQAAGTGAIAPFNTTYDMLLGGTSTSSAKFAFIGNAGVSTPVASISAQNGNGTTGLVLGGDGSIQALNNNTLTIGGGTTGNIAITPNNGSNGLVTINAPTVTLNGTSTLNASSLGTLNTAATLTISGATALSDSGLATLTTASSLAMSSTSTLTLASNATINGGANANDDLTLQGTSNGTRLTSYVIIQPNGGAVGIGTTNPLATLDIRGNTATTPVASIAGATTNASAIVDQTGSGDIFTASKSGSTKFVVNNSGNLQLTGGTNFLTTINSAATAARSITLPDASGTICLQGSASCGFSVGTNYWQAAGTGAITTGNTTFDMLLGGTSTSSARFAFIGNAGVSTPVASISAQNGSGTTGLVLGGDGSIQGLNNNTLTIGGGSTGNIVLKPNNGSNGLVTLTAPTVTLSGTSTLNASSLGTINTGATLTLSGATTLSDSGLANITTAAGLTLGSTTSLTLGSNATINGGANANDDLTLQGTSNPTRLTSYVLIQPNGGAVGIGTSNPLATLDIRGNTATTPASSVAATSTFAGAVIDQTGTGDIFTASKSGATKFSILSNGNISFAGATNFLSTITSAATAVRTFTLPDASGTICLQGSASCGFTTGTNYWQAAGTGAISPFNTTYDVLLGGASSSSAKFAFLNNAGVAIPVASISAQNGNGTTGLSLGGDGSIQSLNNNTLTIGGGTTGNIIISPNGGSNGLLTINASTVTLSGTTILNASSLGTINTGATLTLSGATTLSDSGLANITTAAGLTLGSTTSLTLGSNATINGGANANDDLTLQGTSNPTKLTSYVLIQPNGGAVGVGTTTPLATLDVRGNTATSPVASFSGATTNATAIVDQSGSGDLFTASKSGATKFVINNAGNILMPTAGGRMLEIGNSDMGNFAHIGTTSNHTFQIITNNTRVAQFSVNAGLAIGGTYSSTASLPTNGLIVQGNVGFGTTSPLAELDVRGIDATSPVASFSGTTTNAAAIVDQSGSGDLFTASKSGATKFSILNNGNISFAGATNFLSTITSAVTAARTFTLPDASGTICLQSSANCGFAMGTNYWQAAGTGAIAPFNTTYDMLLGGNSSASAKFAFLNNAGVATPVASISSQTASPTGLALSPGQIQSLNNGTLTIGGSTTGNILLSPNNGSNGLVTINAPTVTLSGTSTLNASSLGTINTGATLTLSGATTLSDSGLANITTAAGLTLGSTTSLTLGSNATINGGANANDDITLQGTSSPTRLTSYVLIQPNGGAVGVGTTTPLATLDVRGNTATSPFASFSGTTTNAGVIVDQSGSGDLFTASKSGATKFSILNNGNISFAGATNFLSTITSAATVSRTYTLPDASGTICLQGSASCGFTVGTNYWQAAGTGAITTGNTTFDLLLGGTSTASAKFAFMNVAGAASPVASISAQNGAVAPAGLSLGAGSIQSLNRGTLNIGGTTTGDIVFQPGGLSNGLYLASNGNIGIGTGTPLAKLQIGSNAQTLSSYFSEDDFLNTSANGMAQYVGNTNWSNPTNSCWGIGPATGSSSDNAVRLGDTIYSSPNCTNNWQNKQTTRLLINGALGATALASLDVSTSSGTLATASLSGATTFANTVIDQSGLGDILTASKSGASKFTVLNNGNLQLNNYASCALQTDASGNVICGTSTGQKLLETYTITAPAGANLTVQFTGANDSAVSSSAGTITFPANASALQVQLKAGGGGGGGTSSVGGAGGGGGEGGYSQKFITGLAANYYIKVGGGGAAGPGGGGAGGPGTQTCFGTGSSNACTGPLASATGGSGGATSLTAAAGGAGGVGANGDLNQTGQAGTGTSGAPFSGNGGGIGGGLGVPQATNGNPGSNGGGGSGSNTSSGGANQTGGAGGNGWITINVYTSTNAAANYWQLNNNVLSPATPTNTLTLGGSSATSTLATLDVRNVMGTEPTASFSGSTSFAGLLVDQSGSGDLFAASKSGSTKFVINNSGNIQFSGGTNFLTTLTSGATAAQTITLPAVPSGNSATVCYRNDTNCGFSVGTNFWQAAAGPGAFTEFNTTYDLLLGGNATSSARFAVLNMAGGATTTPVASLSAGTAGGAYMTASGIIQTTANQTLTLGGTTTGNIILNPASGNFVGIDTQTPLATLDVRGALGLSGGTSAVASISGTTSFAALVTNNSGPGDLFTASSSGLSKFTIQKNGNIVLGADNATATPSAVTIRGAQVSGANVTGGDFNIAASNGNGSGGSGNINLQTASPMMIGNDTRNQNITVGSAGAQTLYYFTHTTATQYSNQVLVLQIQETSALVNINSVIYNGQTMTQAIGNQGCNTLGTGCHQFIYYLVNPPAGAKVGVVNFASAPANPDLVSTNYYNVDQIRPLGTTNSGLAGATGSVGTSVGSIKGQLVADFITSACSPTTNTPGTTQTKINDTSVGTASGGYCNTTSGLGVSQSIQQASPSAQATIMSWIMPGAATTAQSVITLNPAPNSDSLFNTLSLSNGYASASAWLFNPATASTSATTTPVGLAIQLGYTANSSNNANHFEEYYNGAGVMVGDVRANTTGVQFQTSGIADFAEYLPKDPTENIPWGTVVCEGPDGMVHPCSVNTSTLVGVASENPSFVGGVDKGNASITVGLTGQIATRVSTENGSIKAGDMLTYSTDMPGIAVKATSAGPVLGKAEESYDESDPTMIGKVLAIVQPSWYDPAISIAQNGNVSIFAKDPANGDTNQTLTYGLADQNGAEIKTTGAFGNAWIGNLQAGIINAKNVLIGGKSVADRLDLLDQSSSSEAQLTDMLNARVANLESTLKNISINGSNTTTGEVTNGTGNSNLSLNEGQSNNPITNPGIEQPLNFDWTSANTATIKRITTERNSGVAALQVTSSQPGDGAKNTLNTTLEPNTSYILSWYIKSGSTIPMGTITAAYSYDGNENHQAAGCGVVSPATDIVRDSWQLVSCQFTTGSQVPTSSNAVFITQDDSTLRNFYLDDVEIDPVKALATDDNSSLSLSGASSSAALIASQSAEIEQQPNNTNTPYVVRNGNGQIITNSAVYQNAAIANLKSGGINAEEINVQSLTLAGQNVGDRLASLESNATSAAALTTRIDGLSDSLNSLKDKVATLEATLNLMASGSALLNNNPFTFQASSAAQLDLDKLIVNTNLSVLGKTTVADLGVTGHMTIGLLGIEGLNASDGSGNAFASINTSAGLLKIQSEGLNGVDFENGKLTIDTQGSVKTQGAVTATKFNVDTSSVQSATLGTATLPAGETSIVINTTAVTKNSAIFVTPRTKTSQPLSVTTQTAGKSFKVEIDSAADSDIKFNWWIVN